jgi:hypothetical protein
MSYLRLAGLGLSVLIATGVFSLLEPKVAAAGEIEPLPDIYTTTGAGISGWRPASCRCVDRYRWGGEFGVGVSWHRLLRLEANLLAGGMVFPKSGYFPYLGWSVGYRAHPVPMPREWWQNFYGRVGFARLSIAQTRIDATNGAYLRGGWSVNIWGPIHADNELGVSYFSGVMAHLQFGVFSVVRVAF